MQSKPKKTLKIFPLFSFCGEYFLSNEKKKYVFLKDRKQ